MPISLALVRAHLNLDDTPDLPGGYHTDADLLAHYGRVAEAWIASYTGLPFDAENALMVQAALLLIGHQHEAREAVTFSSAYSLPYGVTDLLAGLKRQIVSYVPEPEGAANG